MVTASEMVVPSGPDGSRPSADMGARTTSRASSESTTTAANASTGDGPPNGSDGRRPRSTACEPAAASRPRASRSSPPTNSQRANALAAPRIEIVIVPAPSTDAIQPMR